MGRDLPPIDESVRWPRCPRCHDRHRPRSPCPPPRVWLVAGSCGKCVQSRYGTTYCPAHDVLWALTPMKGSHAQNPPPAA